MHNYRNNGGDDRVCHAATPCTAMYRAVTYCKTVGVGNGVGELWRASRLDHTSTHAGVYICMRVFVHMCVYVCVCVCVYQKK